MSGLARPPLQGAVLSGGSGSLQSRQNERQRLLELVSQMHEGDLCCRLVVFAFDLCLCRCDQSEVLALLHGNVKRTTCPCKLCMICLASTGSFSARENCRLRLSSRKANCYRVSLPKLLIGIVDILWFFARAAFFSAVGSVTCASPWHTERRCLISSKLLNSKSLSLRLNIGEEAYKGYTAQFGN